MTEQATKLTTAEALEVLSKVPGPVRIVEFRPCKMLGELVEPKDDHGKVIHTNQRHGAVNDRQSWVRVEYGQTFRREHGEGPSVSARISFGITVIYEFPEGVPEEHRAIYVKVMGVMHSWSYYRTFVHFAMSQMGAMASEVAPLVNPPKAALMAGYRPVEGEEPTV